MRLSGLKVRKALELELSTREIFQVKTEAEGDIAAKEIYEDDITHTSEIQNIDEIFGEEVVLYYSTPKKEIKINDNLVAYVFDFYLASIEGDDINEESKILSEKSTEAFFLNTKILTLADFLRNVMDAHSFLGQYPKNLFKRKFLGIGSFNMEEYAANHVMMAFADVHLLDFYIKDSNLVSTISNIVSARYEKDIVEQREYFTQEEYDNLLDTFKKHKSYIKNGFNIEMD
jgi:hypothetical protein